MCAFLLFPPKEHIKCSIIYLDVTKLWDAVGTSLTLKLFFNFFKTSSSVRELCSLINFASFLPPERFLISFAFVDTGALAK